MPAQTLAKPLRSQLENTVKAACDTAETAARAAIAQLGVGEANPPEHLDDAQKLLRRRLRTHGRQLDDKFLPSPSGGRAERRGSAGGEGKNQEIRRLSFAGEGGQYVNSSPSLSPNSSPSPDKERGPGGEVELSDAARYWIAQAAKLALHANNDGIVCLPPLRGEKLAAERLLNLLIDAWETVEPGSWKASILDKLLAEADCAGKSLEVWLRDKCFEQHCKRFHHRPFIWHIWDGQKDGFATLVNYHKLDAKNLERLIHTYPGDWIRTQEQGVKDNIDGAITRLAAAKQLQQRLQLIFEGEPPHDIFVRWKPPAQQPIGWNPDLNDGVRLNIRPFMTAEVLRHNKPPKLNIKWDKDCGKDVPSAPWFLVFNGDRINDHHLTVVEKISASATIVQANAHNVEAASSRLTRQDGASTAIKPMIEAPQR